MSKNRNNTATIEQVTPVVEQATAPVEQSKEQQVAADASHASDVMKKHNGVKSPAIRELFAEWKSRGRVAKALNIRYQHVRNVLVTPVNKKASPTPSTESAE